MSSGLLGLHGVQVATRHTTQSYTSPSPPAYLILSYGLVWYTRMGWDGILEWVEVNSMAFHMLEMMFF